MTPHLIFAYDPGGDTGWAWWQPDANLHDCGEGLDRHEFAAMVRDLLRTWPLLARSIEVCGELFTINAQTHKNTQQLDALYINGWVDIECKAHNVPLTLRPPPSKEKRASLNKTLKQIGWYTPTPDGHANSANWQLLLHVANTRYGQVLFNE